MNNRVSMTELNTDKFIKTKKGSVKVKSGDILVATISDEDASVLFRGRFVDIKDGIVDLYVIDPAFRLVDVQIKENRVVEVLKPN